MARNLKTLMMLLLSASLVTVTMLMGGCVGKETTQIIEDITPQEAYTLIQENQGNTDFAIVDVRTPEEFSEEYIEGAINIDFYSEIFQDELDVLDKNKTYLVYCGVGVRSRSALDIMEGLNFREAYNMTGGITQWNAEGLPTIQGTITQTNTDITPQAAYALINNNPDAIIIDVSEPEDFAKEHIEGAINIVFHSVTFTDELTRLNSNKTYIVYCRCTGRGIAGSAVDKMTELDFKEAYYIDGGLRGWSAEGLPTVK